MQLFNGTHKRIHSEIQVLVVGGARLILNPFALRRWSWSWRLDSRRLYSTSSVGQSNLLADTGSGGEDISTCEVIGFQKEKKCRVELCSYEFNSQ